MASVETTLHQVAIDRRALAAALRQLVGDPQMVAYGQAGVNRTPRLTELIVRELHLVHRLPPSLSFPAVCDSGRRGRTIATAAVAGVALVG